MKNFNNKFTETLLTLSLLLSLVLPITTLAVDNPPIELGTAINYAVLAKTGASNTGTTAILGNVGVSPATSTSMTGWLLKRDNTDEYFLSNYVTFPGKIFTSDNTGGTTASDLSTAVSDMQTAYDEALGRYTNLTDYIGTNGNVGGVSIYPSSYGFTNGMTISDDLTLYCYGNPNALFLFQVNGNLNVGAGKKIILTDECQPSQIFWQVSGSVNIGAGATFEGVILANGNITMQNGSTLNGRALSLSGVSFISSNINDGITVPCKYNRGRGTCKR